MTVSNSEMLALARELPIPIPWNRNKFIANLARERGRPIRLKPTASSGLAGSPCGLWLMREHDDIILHEVGTSEYHIDQIVCHEIGHMVLGHDRSSQFWASDSMTQSELYRTVLPDIDPSTVRAILGRHDYGSDREREAEMFANILMIAAAEAEERASMMRSVFFRDE